MSLIFCIFAFKNQNMTKLNTLRLKVQKYMLSHPIDEASTNKYKSICKKFNIDSKTASRWWIETKHIKEELDSPYWERTQTNDTLDIKAGKLNFEIKSLDDLLAACQVDTRTWDVISWQCKKWDLGVKSRDGIIDTKELYSVNAKFKLKTIDTTPALQKDVLLKELFNKAPVFNKITYKQKNAKNLLELALFDVHFGKLAHHEEVGEDYDLKIASERYTTAISNLLSNIDTNSIERILLPIGQDLINIDNIQGTTTSGTPQDCDSRFYKIINTVKEVLISTINTLSVIAPVDVVISVGNHDEQTSFMIGEILKAYYNKYKNVTVYNEPTLRKYYKYGTVGIMFTHGNREKFNELGMIFAAEKPSLWADTTQRYIQIGHFHHNKLQVLQKQEFQGFQVQIIPSLSGSDAWHKGKGYSSLKQAKAFLYNKTKGLVGEFTHTV